MYISNYYAKTMAELLKNVQPPKGSHAVVHVNLSFACNYCGEQPNPPSPAI